MKTIQEEMFAMIESEIQKTIAEGKEKRNVDKNKAISVAKGLVDLSVGNGLPDGLSNDYIALVESICIKQNK